MINELTILFVEDEESIREELGYFLRRLAPGGVLTAANGEEGLKLFREHRPDVVVTDLEMPGMHGMEMIRDIRAIKPSQAILVTTAHSDSRFLIKAIELKVDHYLFKPIDLEVMEEKIRQITHQIRLERQVEQQRLIMEEIANLESNMLMVLDRGMHPIFLNRGFLEYFGIDSLETYVQKDLSLADFMVEQEEGFAPVRREGFTWVRELETVEPSHRIVALRRSADAEVTVYSVSLSHNPESVHRVVALSEITELASLQDFYRRQAQRDELTGLFNRFVFNRRFDERIRHALQTGEDLCLTLVDLDYFKEINDRYGHNVGDEVLIDVGKVLQESLESEDFLARWGGEEFAILSRRNRKATVGLAERIRQRLEKMEFGNGISLQCSCGIASLEHEGEAVSPEKIFRRADQALYQAKNSGRNRVVVYEESQRMR